MKTNWLSFLPTTKSLPKSTSPHISEGSARIIRLDVERTFLDPSHRMILVEVLETLTSEMSGDYHQSMSLIAGFFFLLLDKDQTLEMMRLLRSDKYLKDYWKTEAIKAATDAYVFEHLLENFFPQVASHLQLHRIFPETYCPKFFIALFINILPFDRLIPVIHLFLENGFPCLFQIALSLISVLQEALLRSDQQSVIYDLLRLDPKTLQKTGIELPLFEGTYSFHSKFDLMPYDFARLRTELFESKLKRRIMQANQSNQQQKIKDEEDEEDEEESGYECQICEEFMPEILCKECQVLLCENCHENSKGPHKNSHEVSFVEGDELDNLFQSMKTYIPVPS